MTARVEITHNTASPALKRALGLPQGEAPWWTPTPEELAQREADAAEIDAYDKGIADGTIKPEPLTRAQLIIGRHMQA